MKKITKNIIMVDSKDYSTFYYKYLVDKHGEKTKNFNQLYDTKINANDKKLKLFYDVGSCQRWYFLYIIDGLIVGHLTYQKSAYTDDVVWFSSISVDERYRNQGIATSLIDVGFTWAKDNNYRIVASYYEKDGDTYLKHVLRRKAQEYSVTYIDKEYKNNNRFYSYFQWGNVNHGSECEDVS